MKRAVVGILVLLMLAMAPAARAELVGEFTAGVRDIKSYGGYTVNITARAYDTTGKPPPPLASAVIRFPRGAAIRRQFLRGGFFCNSARLELTPDPKLCRRGHFASGRLVLDARPNVLDAFGATIELFLSRPTQPGAVAAVAGLILPNDDTPVYTFQVLRGNLFNDSGSRFGYRLVLPTKVKPLLPGVTLNLAEFRLKIRGLRRKKRVRRCVRRSRGPSSRCLRRRTRSRTVFWTTTPRCPPRRTVSFGADYEFEGAAPISRTTKVKCSRFRGRRPTGRGRGRIPGAP